MRAFVVTGPRESAVSGRRRPGAAPGQVVVDVAPRRASAAPTSSSSPARWPTCTRGTPRYPLRLGHEWCGASPRSATASTPSWLGRRVTGDTMLGCGRCRRCLGGRQHVCADRFEIGIRGGLAGRPGRAAARAGDGAARAAGHRRRRRRGAGRAGWQRAAGRRAAAAGHRAIARPRPRPGHHRPAGRPVRGGRRRRGAPRRAQRASLDFARALGLRRRLARATRSPTCPTTPSSTRPTAADVPARAVDLVEPGGRVVYIGLSGTPSLIDTRDLVLKDVTAVGILSASPGLAGDHRALRRRRASTRARWSRPRSAWTEVGAVLAGRRPAGAGAGPKIHVDPRR